MGRTLVLAALVLAAAGCAGAPRHCYSVSATTATKGGVIVTQSYSIQSDRPIGQADRMGALLALTGAPAAPAAPAAPKKSRFPLAAERRLLIPDPVQPALGAP